MLRGVVVLITVVLDACTPYPMPKTWQPDTGEVDCPLWPPIGATTAVPTLALVALAAFQHSTEPRTYDQYGYPTNWPAGWRIVGYVAAAQALIGVPVSIYSWAARGRCKQLDARMHALVAARDCATVVKLDGEIAAIDANFRDTVLVEAPGVARCVQGASGSAAQRADSGVAAMTKTARARAAAGDCASVRMLAKQVLKLSPAYYRSEFESDAALVACEIPVE